jgi:hypothetical protein
MRSFYFADRDLRDRVILTIAMCAIVLFLIGPWFEPPGQTVRFFYWSWVQFPGQIACFRPV